MKNGIVEYGHKQTGGSVMEEYRTSVENKSDKDQSIITMPWSAVSSSECFTDLDLVDFRTMLEELEYK